MLSWSITFLVIGLIAGILGLSALLAPRPKSHGFCLLSFWFFL
jgi:uncharacterized membrane protein YtjA (UPF0391 family)